jgi:hypothetical protein
MRLSAGFSILSGFPVVVKRELCGSLSAPVGAAPVGSLGAFRLACVYY